MSGRLALPVVDGLDLDEGRRSLLRPGEPFDDGPGGVNRLLPRWFYEVESWQLAKETRLTEHFTLHEFMRVDLREAPLLRTWPRYVPLALPLLAAHLELLRLDAGTLVWISANGGYRSPAHARTDGLTPHCWGTAADVYRIGDELLCTRERIEGAAERAARLAPALWIRPWGHGPGESDDHLHVDVGYPTLTPRAEDDEAAG